LFSEIHGLTFKWSFSRLNQKDEENKIFRLEKRNNDCPCYFSLADNGLAALSSDKSGHGQHGECERISLPFGRRIDHNDYFFRKDCHRPSFSSGDAQENAAPEYDLPHDLLPSHRNWDCFHGRQDGDSLCEEQEIWILILAEKGDSPLFLNYFRFD
jgi:hypothetical protein